MSEDIKKRFKSFKESQETETNKKITENQKSILKSHIIISEGFKDYDLVQLVMFYNGHAIDSPYMEKFKTLDYINESNKFTNKCVDFLKSNETILKIKKIISES